jgi:hypothetical protein
MVRGIEGRMRQAVKPLPTEAASARRLVAARAPEHVPPLVPSDGSSCSPLPRRPLPFAAAHHFPIAARCSSPHEALPTACAPQDAALPDTAVVSL